MKEGPKNFQNVKNKNMPGLVLSDTFEQERFSLRDSHSEG
jgi:hypothetical protein